MILYLIKLSESDKKKLAILAIIIATIIVLIGYIGDKLKKDFQRRGRHIDTYMYYMMKYNLIKDIDHFKRYVRNRESRNLYFETRWKFRIIIITVASFILYFYNLHAFDFSLAIEALNGLTFHYFWPTEKFFGLRLVSDWPILKKAPNPMLTIDGYFTYISVLIVFIMFVVIFIKIFDYKARIHRAKHLAPMVIAPSLDNIAFIR